MNFGYCSIIMQSRSLILNITLIILEDCLSLLTSVDVFAFCE